MSSSYVEMSNGVYVELNKLKRDVPSFQIANKKSVPFGSLVWTYHKTMNCFTQRLIVGEQKSNKLIWVVMPDMFGNYVAYRRVSKNEVFGTESECKNMQVEDRLTGRSSSTAARSKKCLVKVGSGRWNKV